MFPQPSQVEVQLLQAAPLQRGPLRQLGASRTTVQPGLSTTDSRLLITVRRDRLRDREGLHSRDSR